MAEPPPRDPRDPADDETVISDGWGPETVVVQDPVVVEQTETVARRRMPTIWPGLLALLVAVLVGIGAYLYFAQQDESTVPAVTGLQQERAEARVRDAGLEPRTTRQESAKPQGVVIAQSPDPGSEVDEGADVRLVVSTGPPRETVPDVVGRSESQAVADLTEAGFEAEVTQAFSERKAGLVVAQEPKAGATLKEGSTVALTVSKGGKPVSVPDVVGTTSSQATATVRDAGLEVNVVGVPSDQPSGTVVAQSPAAGKQAKTGSTVRLNVAQAPGETTTQPASTTAPPPATTQPTTTAAQPATVPDVVGQELAEAAKSFAGEGLRASVKYVPSDEPQGRVIAQAQPAGTERKRGDTVQLNVSTGPSPAATAAVPDVVDSRLDEGRGALEQAGFEVLALSLGGRVRNESTIGSQTPAAGASIPGGSLVILYVGA